MTGVAHVRTNEDASAADLRKIAHKSAENAVYHKTDLSWNVGRSAPPFGKTHR
jgi:hypothetical protein